MPLFGMGAELKTGLPMPTQIYWNAVTTNDVVAQSVFNSMETKVQMEHLRMDMMAPELMDRFALLRELKQNFHVVKNAEEAKISLSDSLKCTVDLSYIESGLGVDIDRDQFALAVESPLQKMIRLMESAISESGERPDVIYITGGSAKSPVVQSAIRSKIGDIPVLDGDHFGSVASGLASWSERLFR